MKISLFACVVGALLVVSCAESDGSLAVDTEWHLTCPEDGDVPCGSRAPQTCLGDGGTRLIVGSRGEAACTGDPIIATCEAVERSNGLRAVLLEVNVGDSDDDGIPDFGFELRGATIDQGGSVQEAACNVTIFESGVDYNVGSCGEDPPSMEQPCQLSNISIAGGEVVFDLECKSLISAVTGGHGFDVGALGGGPTTMRFSNCTGF